jgi:hypothetical protein
MPFPLIAKGIAFGVKHKGKFKKAGKALSAISGFFGSKKKREKEREKLNQFSTLLGTQYGLLEDTIGDVQQEFDMSRQFMDEGQFIQEDQAAMGYAADQQNMAGQVASTNLQTGAGQEAIALAQREFANQQMARALQAREQRFNLGMREASRMRNIQAAGFELDRQRAEKGLSSKNYGQSLMDRIG